MSLSIPTRARTDRRICRGGRGAHNGRNGASGPRRPVPTDVLAAAAPVVSGVGSCATGWIVAGQAPEGSPDVVVGDRGMLGERLVELLADTRAEHVQHVVTPKAAAGETLRGLPELGRRVLEDPR